jgi:hypothetical protein
LIFLVLPALVSFWAPLVRLILRAKERHPNTRFRPEIII